MSFKKVGIAQDSNLRGDSLRVQNPDNTLAYSEFVYDGSATMSYTLPSSAGTSGQVLQVSSGTTLVWSTAVGPQGPIGPTGLPGSSGSSGSTGSSGTSGTSGVSGTSGSSGSSGQAATIISQVTTPGFTVIQFNDGTTVPIPDGSSGSAGTDGTSGTSGTSGSSGQDGTSGTSGVSSTVQSYSTSGNFVDVVFLDVNGSTLVPIPVGADGTSGTSGSSGQDGTSGTSGTSGSSGANGVGDATMLGDVNYVPKYIGATALGTASLTSVGDQILFTDGSVAAPGLSFQDDTNTGIYRYASDQIGIAVAGLTAAVFGLSGSIPRMAVTRIDLANGSPALKTDSYLDLTGSGMRFIIATVESLRLPQGRVLIGGNGSPTTPNLSFINDSDTGFYNGSANSNKINMSLAGATAAVFGPTFSFINQTFFNKAVNHTPVTAVATASYVMDMSQSNVFLLTLTASTTLDYTNAQIGSYVIVATQNATGNYSMSLAAGKFQGATWSGVATASNAKTIIQVIYDGSKGIITSQKLTDL